MRQILTYCLLLLMVFSCGKDQSLDASFTTSVSGIGNTSCSITVSTEPESTGKVTQIGVVYSVSDELDYEASNGYYYYGNNDVPLITDVSAVKGNNFSVTFELTGLNDNCQYYYKPFAVVNGALKYGALDSFSTTIPTGFVKGPAGGYVIYDDGNGGGIEAAPFDMANLNEYGYFSNYFPWGCAVVAGTATSVGSGQNNTNLMIQSCSDIRTAATICAQFSYGGYSDWYLPSKDEMELVYTQLFNQGVGNLEDGGVYWTSSEVNLTDAYTEIMSTSSAFYGDKGSNFFVRPVRTF